MVKVPADILLQLRKSGQEHVLAWWDQLSEGERRELVDQLQAIHFDQLRDLYRQREWAVSLPAADRIEPVPVVPMASETGTARRMGEEALRRGEVAALVVAGGQGSRLGFEHPKGMFPISPVKNKTLFQIHAEKVLALSRRHGKPLPLLLMTSPATHAETEAFFRQHAFFGLPEREVF